MRMLCWSVVTLWTLSTVGAERNSAQTCDALVTMCYCKVSSAWLVDRSRSNMLDRQFVLIEPLCWPMRD